MDGLVDWEAAYRELKRHTDEVLMPLLKRALDHVPEDETELRAQTFFEDSIAPKSSNLPVIMTMCTPKERLEAIKLMNARIDSQGNWIDERKKKRRPALTMITQRSRDEQDAGERSSKKHKRQVWMASTQQYVEKEYKLTAAVTLMVTHLKLVEAGSYPTELCNVASHLCHNKMCIDVSHLVWSSQDDNWKRERLCRKQGQCNCDLQPPCNFEAHKK